MTVDTSTSGEATGLSRRRVVQGALWATPALLVATAVPAAAASQPSPGRLIVPTPTGVQNLTVFTMSGIVTYGDDGEAPDDYAVSGVTLKIVMPRDRLVAGNGSFTGAAWSFVNRVDNVPANTATFTYTYPAALSSSATATAPLTVTYPKTNVRTQATSTWNASGTSNAQTVNAEPSAATILAYSLPTFGSTPTGVRDPSTGLAWLGWAFGGARYLNITSSVRNHSGSPSSNTSPIHALVAKVTVPNGSIFESGGAPAVVSGPWSAPSTTVGATTTVYTFTHTASPLLASTALTTANFRVRVAPFGSVPFTVTIAFEGRSGTASGPTTAVSQSVSVTA